jgi:pimeloyl-ACP methyl ester carboxylesterase
MNALPLVLVPGLMCDHTVWEPLLPFMDTSQTCQMIDHQNANSLSRMAEQLLEVSPPKFVMAGHSMGGRVALEVLRMAPDRVAGVALMDTGYLAKLGGEAGELEVSKRLVLLEIAQSKGIRAMAQEWVKGMVHPNRLADKALIETILKMFETKNSDIFARQLLALIFRKDATDVLKSISVPTLILCGRQDAWSPPSQHEEMLQYVPHAAMSVIEDSGHMSTMEKPQAVAEAMNQWLSVIQP